MVTYPPTPNQQAISQMSDSSLVLHWQTTSDEMDHMRETLGRIEMELTKRLEARGATELFAPHHTVKLEAPTPQYDVAVLAEARDILPGDVWEDLYTPASWVELPPKIHMGKLKAARKFSSRIADIIKAAQKSLPPPRLRIRAR